MYYRSLAAVVLRDAQRRVLMQHRDPDAKTAPNKWGFFGGGIENGETPEQALVRELREELQIELNEYSFLRRGEFEEDGKLFEIYFFTGPLRHSVEQLRKQQREGQDLGLFSYEETKKLDTTKGSKLALEELFG